MKILGKVIETIIDILTIPAAVVSDIVTVGGILLERERTFTADHISFIKNDIKAVLIEIKRSRGIK